MQGEYVIYTITGRSNLFNASRESMKKKKNVCTQKTGHTQKKKIPTHRQKL